MNATEQVVALRRACEMAMDWTGDGCGFREFLKKWSVNELTGGGQHVIDTCRDALSATATPPDDHVADAGKMVEQLTKERDDLDVKLGVSAALVAAAERNCYVLGRDYDEKVKELADTNNALASQITETEIVTKERDGALDRVARLDDEMARICAECGEVYDPATPLGRHPAAMVPGFIHALREDRNATLKERDEALAQLDELCSVIEQHHNGYGETGKSLGMKKPESHVAALREVLEEQADISHHKALEMVAAAEPEFRAERLQVLQRKATWLEVAFCSDKEVAQRIADALNAGGGK